MLRASKKNGVNLDKLAQRLKNKPKRALYKDGHAEEKVWINFQDTKEQKRDFNRVCTENQINASAFLRTCVLLLIKNEGDIRKTLNKLKSNDDSTLKSEVTEE